MPRKLLLTSFQTWLPHQKSNSSDDLLESIQKQQLGLNSLFFLRKLPVNIELATQETIAKIKAVQPQSIICCGMAESREQLTIESNAVRGENCIFTSVDLNQLPLCLAQTKVSHNAGKFVCEGLYYQILQYTQTKNLYMSCLFVHIPLLNSKNRHIIEQDFIAVIRFMLSATNR